MDGNATLTTIDGNGNSVTTPLWLQSIQSDSSVEFDDNQVRSGVSYRPIRRTEMFLDFTAIWSLQNYYLMDQFQEVLYTHSLQVVSGHSNNATPMILNYFGTSNSPMSEVYSGWVERIEKEYPRFDDIFVRSYRMNILLPETTGAVLPVSTVITANYLNLFGERWYTSTPVVLSPSKISVVSKPNGLLNNPHIRGPR